MKKILSTALLLFIIVKSHALFIIPSPMKGSVLCDSLSLEYRLPDSLVGKYTYDVDVIKSEETRELELIYKLTDSPNSEENLYSIETDLYGYFVENYVKRNFNTDRAWTIYYTVFKNGQKLYKTKDPFDAYPYQSCYQVRETCDKIKIYSSTLVNKCDVFESGLEAQINGSSIQVKNTYDYFESKNPCEFSSLILHTDSLEITNLESKVYALSSYNFSLEGYYDNIGTADLRKCPEYEPENIFGGSERCGNLSLTMKLPKDLQGRYKFDYRFESAELPEKLICHYFLNTDPESDSLYEINTQFRKGAFWSTPILDIIQVVYIDKKPVYSKSSLGIPHSRCYQIDTDCETGLTLIRKGNPCRLSKGENLYTTKGDSLIVIFNDLKSETNCENYYPTWSDSIIISELPSKDYKLFTGVTSKGISTETISEFNNLEYQGKVEFKSCIITSIARKTNLTNSIYPNPTTGTISIPLVDGEIILINQLGQKFQVKGHEIFDISSFEKGFYLVSYERYGQIHKEKIFIK